jgi:hypothetical protein
VQPIAVGTVIVCARGGVIVIVEVVDPDVGVWVLCKGVGVITTGVVDSWITDMLDEELMVGNRVEVGI